MKKYIYIIKDPISKEVRYVGQTCNVKNRIKNHGFPTTKSEVSEWLKDLKNKKIAPIVEIVDESEEDYDTLEKFWIAHYKKCGHALFNITDGGRGSSGIENHWNNREVSIYDLNGEYIRSFVSIKDCAKFIGCTYSLVKSCALGRVYIIMDKYQARYGSSRSNIGTPERYKTYRFVNKPKVYWTCRGVKCIEDDISFNSVSDAAKHYNVLCTTISNIIYGRAKKTRSGKSFCRI